MLSGNEHKAPLGLARDVKSEREGFDELDRQFIKLDLFAGFEFKLDFSDRQATSAGDHRALVKGDFNFRLAKSHLPNGAA